MKKRDAVLANEFLTKFSKFYRPLREWLSPKPMLRLIFLLKTITSNCQAIK
jgi:hypothetical protein